MNNQSSTWNALVQEYNTNGTEFLAPRIIDILQSINRQTAPSAIVPINGAGISNFLDNITIPSGANIVCEYPIHTHCISFQVENLVYGRFTLTRELNNIESLQINIQTYESTIPFFMEDIIHAPNISAYGSPISYINITVNGEDADLYAMRGSTIHDLSIGGCAQEDEIIIW